MDLFEKERFITVLDNGRDLSKEEIIEQFKKDHGIKWNTVKNGYKLNCYVARMGEYRHSVCVYPSKMDACEMFMHNLNIYGECLLSTDKRVAKRLEMAGYVYMFGDLCVKRQELFSYNSPDYEEMDWLEHFEHQRDKLALANELGYEDRLTTVEKIALRYQFKDDIIRNGSAIWAYTILKEKNYIDYDYNLLSEIPTWIKLPDLPYVEARKVIEVEPEPEPEYLTEENAINLAKEMGVNPSFLIQAVNCI